MDEKQELYNQLAAFASKLNSAADWGLTQAPEVIRQLIQWTIASDILFILASLIPISILLHCLRKGKADDWYNPIWAIASILSGIFAIIFLVGAIVKIFNLVELWLAPKVWLFEYAAKLVSPHCK